MDENMSDDDNRDNPSDYPTENAKRLKTDPSPEESSSSSSNNTEKETASTSTDSVPLIKTFNGRNRNYRSHSSSGADRSENETHESNDEDSVMQEEESEQSDFRPLSATSSDSTVIHDTDTDSEEEEEENAVLKKEKPKHSWFVIPELIHRQMGYSSKMSPDLFRNRCYGSLRNVQRLELMYKLEEHEGCVNSLNFSPDGSLLASGSDDLKCVLWDWKFGKCLLKYDTKHKSNVFQSKFLQLSGDLHIVTCSRDGQVRIAQVSRQEGVRDNRKLGSHRGACHKVSVLAEQPHVVLSAGEDGLILSHDVRKSKSERIVKVRDAGDKEVALYSVHGHPLKSHEFCVSGRDDVVRVYDQRKTNDPRAVYHPFKKNPERDVSSLHVTCAVYNHDGSEILASYNDADIYLFDVNATPGNFVHQYQGHRNGATIKGVSFFGPRSEFVVSGSDCGNIYFWERNTESIVQWMLADDNGVVNCLEPHPQLPFICTSGLDWDVKVWIPSCETDPTMTDLAKTIRDNNKSRMAWSTPSSDVNESQMLWMLWRHLRSTSRMRRIVASNAEDILLHIDAQSSSSASSSGSESGTNDDDFMDGPAGCAAS